MRHVYSALMIMCLGIFAPSTPFLHAQISTNTLVTGVILDQNGRVTTDPITVRVMANKQKLGEVRSEEGLFLIELKGIAEPETNIIVLIKPQGFELGQPEKARQYAGTKVETTLAKAQNLALRVDFKYVKVEAAVGPYSELPAR